MNDLGSTPGGVGQSGKVADGVVEEIRKNGGIAVANYGERMQIVTLISAAMCSTIH